MLTLNAYVDLIKNYHFFVFVAKKQHILKKKHKDTTCGTLSLLKSMILLLNHLKAIKEFL
tara:strand:- start:7788 stop:7967 length:180 start_codon:yes stop_codon:yes gene_type:complete